MGGGGVTFGGGPRGAPVARSRRSPARLRVRGRARGRSGTLIFGPHPKSTGSGSGTPTVPVLRGTCGGP